MEKEREKEKKTFVQTQVIDTFIECLKINASCPPTQCGMVKGGEKSSLFLFFLTT